MKLYHCPQTAADADRIATAGFDPGDQVALKLSEEVTAFGILVSTELDPRTRDAVELDLPIRESYLERNKLTSPTPGMHYYFLPLEAIRYAKVRRVVGDADVPEGQVKPGVETPGNQNETDAS